MPESSDSFSIMFSIYFFFFINFTFSFFLSISDNFEEDEAGKSFFNLSEVRLYTVIGLIAALVFVALLQATCTIYKTSSSSRNPKVNFKLFSSVLSRDKKRRFFCMLHFMLKFANKCR